MENTNFKEEDINRVAQEIERQNLNAAETPRETVREAVRSAYPTAPNTSSPSTGETTPPASSAEKNLPDYLVNAPVDVKTAVERFISRAEHDGIAKAISAASAAGPFMLDALHDAIVDKLYPEVVNKGII